MRRKKKKRLSPIFSKEKEKALPILLGCLLVFFISLFYSMQVEPIKTWTALLDNISYDLVLRQTFKPLATKEIPIAIVDIDDRSIQEVGRWPWPRKKQAELAASLHDLGAAVIAFDITFPKPENNIASEVLKEIEATPRANQGDVVAALKGVEPIFDYDGHLAESLRKQDSVLGIVFAMEEAPAGHLAPPLLSLTYDLARQLSLFSFKSYIGNTKELQEAAGHGGFLNAIPDSDGTLRTAPLLIRYEENLYPSLALEAVRRYLLTKETELVIEKYEDLSVLEGIKLDRFTIPTDEKGRILIPFRGLPYTFPYIAATDVLQGRVAKEQVEGKLLFIGSTAAAIGDLHSTAIYPIFPGVEVQACIAMGLIDHYLPYKPAWARGATMSLLLIFGALFALLLPHLTPRANLLISLATPLLIIGVNRWVWLHHGIVISVLLPVALILLLFVLNIAWGYFFESKRHKAVKSIFGQYVPAAYLDRMLQKRGSFSLEGESKELTVLFTDIRNFTGLSETMTASQLKGLLNAYLTPMTELIFANRGTIDKYVGDMIMAFWGAPLEDPEHAAHAIATALAMNKALKELNPTLPLAPGQTIRAGIGINTGQMNVGDMGSKYRRAYTVLGDSVNLASRLEGMTKQYSVDILVGENTEQLTREKFLYRKLDNIRVKGKEKATAIFQPLCPIEQATDGLRERVERHALALDHYFKGQWNEAENLFSQLKSEESAPLYDVYLERMAKLKQSPQIAWDGVYVSETK